MKKTIKTLLLLCLSLVLCIVFLTSCNGNNSTDATQEGDKPNTHTHSFGEWVVTKEATCLADGAQERACACGEKEVEVIKAKGSHAFGEWVVTKEATCLADGAQERACACGEKEKQTLGAKGHKWITVKEPTAKEDGLKEQKCTVCGEKTATVYYNSTYYSSENPFMNIPSVKKIVFGGTKVPNSICKGMNALESVLIENSVTSIGDYAFYNCRSLTSVEIGDSVTSIGSLAFCHCSSLTSVEIPDSVTSIGNSAFGGCSSLTSVRYAGTKAEWEAIEKGSVLFDWSCVMEIVCSDGTVSRY